MKKPDNEMYALVDEEYMLKFSDQHLRYMKEYFYSFYLNFCRRINRSPLAFDEFFKNMHLRRFQLYQLCCPYCGTISLLHLSEAELMEITHFERGSALISTNNNNIQKQSNQELATHLIC